MAASLIPSPQEVMKALQTLNDEKTKLLVFYLGVDIHILDNTDTRFIGENRRIHYIQTWLDSDTEASWDKIISGLEQIGMNALAKQVTTQHCQPHQPTTLHTTLPTTSPALVAVPSPVATGQPVTSHHTHSLASTSSEQLATSTHSQPVQIDVLTKQIPTEHISPDSFHSAQPSSTSAQVAMPSPGAPDDRHSERAVIPKKINTERCLWSSNVSLHVVDTPKSVLVLHTDRSLCPMSHMTPSSNAVIPITPEQPASDHSLSATVTFFSVEKVKTTIVQLEDTFLDVITEAEDELHTQEEQDQRFLSKFRKFLQLLRVARNACHVKFFRESENDILAAKDVRKIMAILCRYLDYRNYEILYCVITKFCTAPLQGRMQDYCKMLEAFEKATTVEVYLIAMPSSEKSKELESAFSEMVVNIDKPASQCTLYEVRKLNEELIKVSSLCSHSVYIGSVANKCVEVVVRFPSSAVGWVLAAMTPDFVHTHHLTEVVVDGKQLTVYQRERRVLNDELIAASEAGDVVTVVSLLNSGADINTGGTKDSATALYWAGMYCHLQVVRLLLHRGADVECRDWDGYTPLIYAAWRGKCDIVLELLESGADVNARNNDGDSALMEAVIGGHTETFTELFKAEANLDIQNKDGDTALVRAARRGRTEAVKELVKATANLDLQNNEGDSAVIRATVEHESDVLRVLVGAGSDLNLQNEEGLTALMIAARSGRSDITDLLLEGEHIDLDIQENSTGWSALFFSAERGDVALTTSFLRAGANVHLKDKNGLTVLEVARAKAEEWERQHNTYRYKSRNYAGVIDLLIQHIEDSAAPPSHHDTPSTEQDSSAASDQITSTTGQRRRRRRVPQVTEALRNLVNASGQRIQQIFNQLDRRLKSADKKTQSGVRGQGRDKGQKTTGNPDNQTRSISTTNTSTVKV